MGDRCAGCFLQKEGDEAEKKIRCSGCDKVWFCSERCKDGAMAGGHAAECQPIKRYFADNAEDEVDGFIQFSALHRHCGMEYPELDGEPMDSDLPYLVPTTGDKADTVARWAQTRFPWRDFCGDWEAEQTAGARHVGLLPQSMTDETVKKEIVRSRMNDFFIQTWSGGDPTPMAGAAYPIGALLNHSCEPSCVCSYRLDVEGTHPTWIQEFRCAVDSLSAGEELTHAYVDASDWSNHRRAELLDRYGFVCACPRCPTDEYGETVNPPEPTPFPYSKSGMRPPLSESMTQAEQDVQMARFISCQEFTWAQIALEKDKRAFVTVKLAARLIAEAEHAEEVAEERTKATKAAGLLRGMNIDPDSHLTLGMREPFDPCPMTPMRIKATQMASNMAMFESDFEASLRLGDELIGLLEEGYGTRWHAKIANELLRLGGVAGDGMGDNEKAAEKFREAIEIGSVTTGPDSWVCERAKAALAAMKP